VTPNSHFLKPIKLILYQTLDKSIEESKMIRKPFSLVFLDMDNFTY